MNNYDKIWNCNGFLYDVYEIVDTCSFISFDGDQNIRGKKTKVRTRSFCPKWYIVKDFHLERNNGCYFFLLIFLGSYYKFYFFRQ